MATGMNMATTDIIEIKPICYSDSNSLNYFLAGRDKQDSQPKLDSFNNSNCCFKELQAIVKYSMIAQTVFLNVRFPFYNYRYLLSFR